MECVLVAAEPARQAVLRALDPASRLALRRSSRLLAGMVPRALCVPSVRWLARRADAALLREYDAAVADGYYDGGGGDAHEPPCVNDARAAIEADNDAALAWLWGRGVPRRIGEYAVYNSHLDHESMCCLAACGARHRVLALLCAGDVIDDDDCALFHMLCRFLDVAPPVTVAWFLGRYATRLRDDVDVWCDDVNDYPVVYKHILRGRLSEPLVLPCDFDALGLLALVHAQRRLFEDVFGPVRREPLAVLLGALACGDLEAAARAAEAVPSAEVAPLAPLCAAACARTDAVRALEWVVFRWAPAAAAAPEHGQTATPARNNARPILHAARRGSLDAMLWLEARGLDAVDADVIDTLVANDHVAPLSHLLRRGFAGSYTPLHPRVHFAGAETLDLLLETGTCDPSAGRGAFSLRTMVTLSDSTRLEVLRRRRLLPEPPGRHYGLLPELVRGNRMTAANFDALVDAGYWPPEAAPDDIDASRYAMDVARFHRELTEAVRDTGNELLGRAYARAVGRAAAASAPTRPLASP